MYKTLHDHVSFAVFFMELHTKTLVCYISLVPRLFLPPPKSLAAFAMCICVCVHVCVHVYVCVNCSSTPPWSSSVTPSAR